MGSDKFVCCDIERLFRVVLGGEDRGEIFGIPEEIFFRPKSEDPFKIERYGQRLETPIGVAAGPHTQLSQNIICSWLTGARYIELKTVQILDELEVTKPCIDMTDEGYNCEWSQELRLEESFDEYLNAWIIIHILKDKLGFTDSDPGFIFNISAGYNLEGIMSPSVSGFFDKMNDASARIKEKIDLLAKHYPRIKDIRIPNRLTDNITISTMHGCPPDEIERIAEYFIEEKRLHTTIKLNPTLLGPERLREILNKRLGFDIIAPDEAFDHDLKYDAGVALIKSSIKKAENAGVEFNLKLTNTLETLNIKKNLPEKEKMHYMSGRALHSISINLAALLQKEFNGNLDISFAAGIDLYNITDVLKCGLAPITVCSDILKPGGYGRISQYMDRIGTDFERCRAKSLEEYIINNSEKDNLKEAAFINLQKYAEKVITDPYYKKSGFPYDSIKTDRELEYFDCAHAPCMTKCPADQNIPKYIGYIAADEIEKAYMTILADNPLPNIQGRVCDHLCVTKCTRINYDTPLMIRELKRYITENADDIKLTPASSNGLKAAIIGGGPSGLSCAHFLALNGFSVSIYEAKDFLGGMAADGIPLFRLDEKSLRKDIDSVVSLGVKVYTNTEIDADRFRDLKESYDYLYIAIGAQKSLPLEISNIESEGVYDQLSFLSGARHNRKVDIGDKIMIIGGGNSAIDAARTAKRLAVAGGKVTILYRRTEREMPCGYEEIGEALAEGIELMELVSPEAVRAEKGRVTGITLSRMRLDKADKSGRPRPVKIENSEFTVDADTIIVAIGQRLDLDFYPNEKLTVNSDTYMTDIENVFAGGDALRGASTLIDAIGDGKKAAFQIMKRAGKRVEIDIEPKDERKPDYKMLELARTRRIFGSRLSEIPPEKRMNFDPFIGTLEKKEAEEEASRCLSCDLLCGICATVCPNRCNIYYEIKPFLLPEEEIEKKDGEVRIKLIKTVNIEQKYQILNIGDFCNECGNCTVFCPSKGAPYKDKPKFHLTSKSFENSKFGFYFDAGNEMKIKSRGRRASQAASLIKSENKFFYESDEISLVLNAETLRAEKASFKIDEKTNENIGYIAEYAFLYIFCRKTLLLSEINGLCFD